MQEKISKCKILFLYHVESLNVTMKSLRSSITINQRRLFILALSILCILIRLLHKDPMRGPGDGMASSVGDCSRVSSLSKQESDILFSLPMTPFHQIQCLPSFNHSIHAPADNGIKMSHTIIIIMSKSLNLCLTAFYSGM